MIKEEAMKKGDYVSVQAMETILGESLEGKLGDAGKVIQTSRGISDDYIGNCRLFQTFCRNSLLSPYKYAGLCKYGEKINLHPRKARRIFLVSQLRATENFSQEFNERFAAAMAKRYIFEAGDMPIVPHLYFTQFLSDEGYEREYGMEAGHMAMNGCDGVLVAVIGNEVSAGMAEDISYATRKLGINPKYVHLSKGQAMKLVGEWEQERYEAKKRAAKHR